MIGRLHKFFQVLQCAFAVCRAEVCRYLGAGHGVSQPGHNMSSPQISFAACLRMVRSLPPQEYLLKLDLTLVSQHMANSSFTEGAFVPPAMHSHRALKALTHVKVWKPAGFSDQTRCSKGLQPYPNCLSSQMLGLSRVQLVSGAAVPQTPRGRPPVARISAVPSEVAAFRRAPLDVLLLPPRLLME